MFFLGKVFCNIILLFLLLLLILSAKNFAHLEYAKRGKNNKFIVKYNMYDAMQQSNFYSLAFSFENFKFFVRLTKKKFKFIFFIRKGN